MQRTWLNAISDFKKQKTGISRSAGFSSVVLISDSDTEGRPVFSPCSLLSLSIVEYLNDRVTSDEKPWYWNESSLADYRATSAPEYMERLGAAPTQADELREARRYLANSKAEIERLLDE